mmetsp:Transcript_62544/g.177625  ORF Transcript_62544/g.177625 Transcript_62544/m.177625 type:complete len:204 (-) Transcript_62544:7-618(-)
MAEQQALCTARVEGSGHPPEHGVALLVCFNVLLDDVRLVSFQRVHPAYPPALGGAALLRILALVVVSKVRRVEATQDPVRVGVDAIHAAGVDPRRGLDCAASLVEAVLFDVAGLCGRCRRRLAARAGQRGLAATHEGVDDVVHVVNQMQVEGVLGRDLILVHHLHAFGVEVAQGRAAARPGRRHGRPAAARPPTGLAVSRPRA